LLTEKINPDADKVVAAYRLPQPVQNIVALADLRSPKTDIRN